MTSMEIVQFSRPPHPLVQLRPKFFHPLDLGRPISNEPPLLLQMITNQLKVNQGCLLNVSRSFLPVGFRFQYQLIILVWLSIDFFLAEANLEANLFCLSLTAKRYAEVKIELKPHHLLFCGFKFLCVELSKNIRKRVFLTKVSFSTHFAIYLFDLHNLKT